jgi:hypothetical protein
MGASENKDLDKVSAKDISQQELIDLLLAMPVFTSQQIKAMKQARKEINRWRGNKKDYKI